MKYSERYIKKFYQRKKKLRCLDFIFNKNWNGFVTYRDVIKNQSNVYKPYRSKWFKRTLLYSYKYFTKQSKKIKIPFVKTQEEMKEKNDGYPDRNFNQMGLNRSVLLTDQNEKEYIVIDGNHRFSNFFLLKKKKPKNETFTVYVGIVKTEIFDKWKKWQDESKAPVVLKF